ncbi:response regulator [Aestuariicella hydrocarbonica]|uniref:Chemotaxis protein CheA n=1 Tax=Pseudomaricurvus hydrocarbonicus TaxID=1470433 RepID=A0A9E5MNV1_9GAMM|nr:Hpt domain-containing protein [Aestuariicella hydrocarbonica]NHO67627.1 response regulator [Aestuariicella hydrocarbonica]
MADNRNFAALDWVIGEIDETLKQARQSLEAYVENPQDSTRIRFCLTHIHQVHGSLQMVEFFGAALLAEEMEAVAQALMNGDVSNQGEAHEVLMRAILQLPLYLDQIKAKRNDDPGTLLPILNDLRAARGSSLLSESQFFSPDLSAAKKIMGEKSPAQANPAQFKAVLEKLRQMYQYAAAGVIRGVKVDENLQYLQKVFTRLHTLTAGTGRQPLWDIAQAVVEGLTDEQIEISVSVKTLLRQLDKEIRLLAEHGVKALNSYTREELIKNLLYYVARSQVNSSRIERLRRDYALDEALPEQLPTDASGTMLSGPDPETMRTVVNALNDELAIIKEALDDGLSGNDDTLISEALPVMKRVADTLAVLSVGDLRKQILLQIENLEAASSQGGVSNELLMTVADEILAIEQHLEALASNGNHRSASTAQNSQQVQLNRAQETVLSEARNGLELAKDAIIEYIASQWNKTHLTNVPQQLEEIRGGLAIIPLARPAAVLQGCSRYIQEELLTKEISPEWSALDTLADAIASVEYFLERLSGDREDDDDVLLSLAEESIASLGYGVTDAARSAAPVASNSASTANAASVLEKMAAVENVAIDALPVEHQTVGDEPADAVDDEPVEASVSDADDSFRAADASSSNVDDALDAAEGSLDVVEDSRNVVEDSRNVVEDSRNVVEDSRNVVEDSRNVVEDSPNAAEESPGTVEEPANAADGAIDTLTATTDSESLQGAVKLDEAVISNSAEAQASVGGAAAADRREEAEDDIDDEILEIFVEEAGEVLEAIDEFFPLWSENFDDKDSLNEFRRAFHTLKGSGRMVGANDIGELAWSVENMLNRIRDGVIAPHAVQVTLITCVRAVLPEFIHAFEHKQPNPNPQYSEQLSAWAESIGLGHDPEALLADLQGYSASSAAPTTADDTPVFDAPVNTAPILEEESVDRSDTVADLPEEQFEPLNAQVEGVNLAVTEPERASESIALTVDDIPVLEELATESLLAPSDTSSNDLADADRDQAAFYAQPSPSAFNAATVADSDSVGLDDGAGFGAGSDEDDDSGESNAILWEIFGSEAIGHLSVVEDFIAEMEAAAPLYTPPSEAMQRALHTLKGSSHMADVYDIAELATPLERFAKELRTYQVNINDDILQLIKDGVTYTHQALAQIRSEGMATIVKLPQFLARVAELRDLFVVPLIRQHEQREEKVVDPKLLSIFMAEEMNLLLDADVIIAQWQLLPSQPDKIDLISRELNTLAKGAEHANLLPMSFISRQLAAVYQVAGDDLSAVSAEEFQTLLTAHEKLLDMVDAVAAGQNLQPMDDLLGLQLQQLQQHLEAESALPVGAETSGLYRADVDDAALDGELASGLDELVSEDLAAAPLVVAEPYAVGETFEGNEAVVADDSQSEEYPEPDLDWGEPLDVANVEVNDAGGTAGELAGASMPADNGDGAIDAVPEAVAPEIVFPTTGTVAADDVADEDDIDPEIIEIFLEEADELMEDIEQAVHDWSEDWSRMDCSEELQRALHTLKGGARLSGMTAVGNIAHDFETDVIHLSENAVITQDFFVRVNAYQDQLLKSIEAVKAGMAGQGDLSEALTFQPETVAQPSVPAAPAEAQVANTEWTIAETPSKTVDSGLDSNHLVSSAAEQVVAAMNKVSTAPADNTFQLPPGTSKEVAAAGGALATPFQVKRNAPQEVVKVSAELLEELVNLAGETSISRGRMEEQVSELGYAIDEMDATIARLQEQLRRLDIETEAQILFRQEQMAEQDDFDPLEMDRYSQLQQLSRSLIESASDLMDLKVTLQDKTRDTETLLLQQSRINTDLQEGLMRSRMVPFSRMVPRLRRIVRQISSELDKRVNFELDNVEGEMDRTVLERMVAPLEHMLRNAVDHGIESPQQRMAAGKPESGRIVLTLGREGGDVILRLIDDGRGINLERVRAKAIERGLMSAEAKLTDREIMQFILHAGFSTAESVTQISGRGVGMDVVHSEIKQLGGAVSINSRWGEGTEFTVRLPFTVSVNRALMVRIGDDRYAVPLNAIEGIVRVSPFELEHYYQDEQARFEYAGEKYKVNYMGNLLHSDARPKLEGQAMPLPVVLVRTGPHAVAMQVDMLMGSREVVVKSLGPQFGLVQGVSGATVMGDGSVVVILDPHAMVRKDAALLSSGANVLQKPQVAEVKEQVKLVMVVDDSVTVRKVTTRFLEREGYEVITAKDGADALVMLQDQLPDVMLLDIEMPRMDGFEVAKNMRSSSRLKDIPIIMITSRTGQKHRERALSLGVNRYLGKPYQEDTLLQNILAVTGEIDDSGNDDFASERGDAEGVANQDSSPVSAGLPLEG